MAKYYILMIAESIKAFSVIGHGLDFKFSLEAKGQETPFVNLQEGDKVIGYISNDEKRFAYVFHAKGQINNTECELTKMLETVTGPELSQVPEYIQKIIFDNENTSSMVEISRETFSEIMKLMMNTVSEVFLDDEAQVADSGITKQVSEEKRVSTGENILLYGVPGSGKSWTIQHEYCDDEKCMERLVFHPDYMYSDFVGQILPVVKKDDAGNEKVRYEFKPGPFTKILKKAYEDPKKSYYLVIEEINRGNAPAIFGEIFQLLDRMDEDKEGYKKGTSEYGITNENIALEVYGNADTKVRIPANLSILGTMNTSDQNVFDKF